MHRAVKMNLANEGLEAKKKEEEQSARKRKAEEDAAWEGTHFIKSKPSCKLTFKQLTGSSASAAGDRSQLVARRRRKPRSPSLAKIPHLALRLYTSFASSQTTSLYETNPCYSSLIQPRLYPYRRNIQVIEHFMTPCIVVSQKIAQ